MTPIVERGAGLDIHQATIVATVRVPDGHGGRTVTTQTFGTMTVDLLTLRDWLQACGVTHVAMESTGVYWKPIYYLLEDGVTVVLVNMQHLKIVPGRKSDVSDSAWLAQCLEWGLLKGSLVPPAAIRDLRDLTRYRKKQIEDRTQEVNRLHKVLEEAGLKLSTVLSDVLGKSGRAMLEALVAGTTDAATLADLARGRLRQTLPALRDALRGHYRAHHAFLITQILAKVDFLEEVIATVTEEIDRQVRPFEPTLTRLTTVPGIARRTAITIVAETGGDMAAFATAGHLCSWAGMCPGHNESAGKPSEREDPRRQSLLARRAHRSRLGLYPRQGHGVASALSAYQAPPRPQEGRRRRGASIAGDRVLHHARWRDLSRTRGRILYSARS
jgi:transposase